MSVHLRTDILELACLLLIDSVIFRADWYSITRMRNVNPYKHTLLYNLRFYFFRSDASVGLTACMFLAKHNSVLQTDAEYSSISWLCIILTCNWIADDNLAGSLNAFMF